MHVLFLVLNATEYLDEILAAFIDIGVTGATILDSQGMASAIANNLDRKVPLFGSLKSLLNNSRPYNKTVFAVIENKELLNEAIKTVEDIVGDMSQPGMGLMFSVPIGRVYGLRDNTE